MNNEKIILELFSRVKDLESKVENLEKELLEIKSSNEQNEEEENVKITRSLSRDYIINKIKENNKNLNVEKANRAMGNGIVITNTETGEVKKAKFYHSRSFQDFVSGWNSIGEEDLNDNNMDYFIFNVEFNKDFYSFIFTSEELRDYIKNENKMKYQDNKYHFYFQIKNGKVIECREGIERDASKYLNRWNIF